MRHFKLKIDGKVFEGTAPESWKEITVEQYIALETDMDVLDLMEVLTGIKREKLENYRGDLSKHIQRFTYIYSMPDISKLKRGKVLGYELPKDIAFERYGQKMMLEQLIVDNEDLRKAIPQAVAIYLVPKIYGEFDSSKVAEVTERVLNTPAYQVVPHAIFFLRSLINYKTILLMS